jgi:hypothetical protein
MGFFWYHPYQGDPTLVDHTLNDVDSKWQKQWKRHLESVEGCLPLELARLLHQCEYVRLERTMFAQNTQVCYESKENKLPVYIIGDTHILGDGCETDVAIARILSGELEEGPYDDLKGWIHDITVEAIHTSRLIYGLGNGPSYHS